MTEIEDIKRELERQELNALINRGMRFEVERTSFVRQPGLLGWLKKRKKHVERLTYKIQEPTLAVLDLIAAEQIDLHIDEIIMSSETGLQEARKIAKQHTKRLAKIVALAVLGEDYIRVTQVGARFKYDYDDKRLEELTNIFFSHIKPSRLFGLVSAINAISNLGDFMNSIRLMSANRTTMPILIEKNKEG